jgi:glutaminyl-peptide cyclotransferase
MGWHRGRCARWLAGAGVALAGVILPAQAFPAQRALEHLHAQCAFGPRVPGTPAHRACRAYIAGVLRGSGGRVEEQTFTHTPPGLGHAVELTNIIARFGPRRSGGLLFGAHWDSRPWADLDPDSTRRDEPISGANDGASGTAVLLALAETWATDPPPIPVLLVFFDGEDLGRSGYSEEYAVGSRYLSLQFPPPLPSAGLVLDMVASETAVFSLEASARGAFPEFARLVDDLALELGLTAYQAEAGPAVYDDHVPLVEAGLMTLLLVDFRDPHWHTQDDTPRHCAAEPLGQAGRLVERLVEGGFFR